MRNCTITVRGMAGAAAGLFLLATSLAQASSAGPSGDLMARYRNTPESHGLYEIREAARAFLDADRDGKYPRSRPLDPDQRIWVPRCAVPLTTRWARKTIYDQGPGVDVLCKKSVDRKHIRSWDVFVPLTNAALDEKYRRLREQAARKAAADR